MGTRMRLLVRGDDAAEVGPRMFGEARAALESVERETSAFRSEGPVARIRAAAGSGEWIPVGAHFDAALDLALEAARASGGAFNPLVAPLLEAHGFARSPVGVSPEADELDSAVATGRANALSSVSPRLDSLLELSRIERRS